MRRVFLDSNVLIAGAYSRLGASRAVLMLAEAGLFRIIVSRQVIDEAERNLRLKLPVALPYFAELLIHLQLEIIQDPAAGAYEQYLEIIEEKDAPILAAAVAAQVDRLVTLNTKDFTPVVAERSGLRIQSPSEFIEAVREIVTSRLEGSA